MDPGEVATRHRQIARHARADREHDRVEARAHLVGLDVDTDVDADAEDDALVRELTQPPLDDPLLDLEVGHAEAHEPAPGLVALEHRDVVAGAVQLLRPRNRIVGALSIERRVRSQARL